MSRKIDRQEKKYGPRAGKKAGRHKAAIDQERANDLDKWLGEYIKDHNFGSEDPNYSGGD